MSSLPEWLRGPEWNARAAWAHAGWPPTRAAPIVDPTVLDARWESHGQRLVQRGRIAGSLMGGLTLHASSIPGIEYSAAPFQDYLLAVDTRSNKLVVVASMSGTVLVARSIELRLGECSALEAMARTLCRVLPERVATEGLIPWEHAPVVVTSEVLEWRPQLRRARERST